VAEQRDAPDPLLGEHGDARLLQELWESLPEGALLVGANGKIVMANAAAERIFGYGQGELGGSDVELLVPERYRRQHRRQRARYSAAPRPRTSSTHLDLVGLRKDGSELPVEVLLSPLPNRANGVGVTLATVRDLSGPKEAEDRLSHLAALVESSGDAIFEETTEGVVVFWNPAAERLYGWSAKEIVGKPASVLVPPDMDDLAGRAGAGEHVTDVKTVRLRKDGTRVDVLLTVSPLRGKSGSLTGTSTTARDVSALVAYEAQLRYLADHDALTGVYNRRHFEADLSGQVGLARRYGERSAVIVIDIDGLKEVNDRYGHLAGDEALKAVASALARRLRSTDTLARLGGDELGVILPYAGPDEAAVVADGLEQAVSDIELDVSELDGGRPHKLHLSVSVGTASLDAASAEEALAAADRAMYRQKAAHKAANGPA
jgi:diguanylate cyclase (GGDEF)-like protein/PAS domain S-box-containing protein